MSYYLSTAEWSVARSDGPSLFVKHPKDILGVKDEIFSDVNLRAEHISNTKVVLVIYHCVYQ